MSRICPQSSLIGSTNRDCEKSMTEEINSRGTCNSTVPNTGPPTQPTQTSVVFDGTKPPLSIAGATAMPPYTPSNSQAPPRPQISAFISFIKSSLRLNSGARQSSVSGSGQHHHHVHNSSNHKKEDANAITVVMPEVNVKTPGVTSSATLVGTPLDMDASGAINNSLSSNEVFCRFCQELEPEHELVSPCLCCGTLKYIHQSCLQRWIKTQDNRFCELCKYEFHMKVTTKPFKEWQKLEMNVMERRKIICSVTFHVIALTCVIWSLYVLIERTTEEMRNGLLEWPFWTKLIVVAIGFVGGVVFMYVQCRMYVALCRKWHDFNRTFVVQNISQADLDSAISDRHKLAAAAAALQQQKQKQQLLAASRSGDVSTVQCNANANGSSVPVDVPPECWVPVTSVNDQDLNLPYSPSVSSFRNNNDVPF